MRENDHASWITVTLRYHLYVLRKYRKYVSQNFTAYHGSSLLATKLDLCFQLGNTASWLSKILTKLLPISLKILLYSAVTADIYNHPLWHIVAQTPFPQFQCWLFKFEACQMYQAVIRAIPNNFYTLSTLNREDGEEL